MPTDEILTQWQDYSGRASNSPQATDVMDPTSTTGLDGELRDIKGIVRQLSIDRVSNNPGAGWVDYTGLADYNLGGNPQRTGNNALHLTGDWTAIALVGRKIRVTLSDSSRIVSTILTSTLTGGNTDLTLTSSIFGTGAGVVIVEYSVVGSALAGTSNGYPLDVVLNLANTDFMLAPSQGGTGKTDGTALPYGPASGDLSGNYPGPSVTALGGFAIDLQDPGAFPQPPALVYDKTGNPRWTPKTAATFLATMTFAQSVALLQQGLFSTVGDTGWKSLQIPVTDSANGALIFVVLFGQFSLVLAGGSSGPVSIPVSYTLHGGATQTGFPNALLGVWATVAGAAVSNTTIRVIPAGTSKTAIQLAGESLGGASGDANPYVLAIGY